MAVAVQDLPGVGGEAGERFRLAEGAQLGVRGDDGEPKGGLLGAIQQERAGSSGNQEAMPELMRPGVPGENVGWVPGGGSGGVLLCVEEAAQSARGAMIGGDDEGSAGESLVDLWRQMARESHASVIRFRGQEIRVAREAWPGLRSGAGW